MIAYGMLYTVVVGVPVFVTALLGAGYLRSHGRAERGVWLLALLLALVLPPLGLSRLPAPASPAPRAAAPAPTALSSPVPAGVPQPARFGTRVIELPALEMAPPPTAPAGSTLVAPATASTTLAIGFDEALMGLWLVASMLLALRWAVSALRLATLARSWREEALDGVPVLLTPDVGPAVIGLARPRIVAPPWVNALPPERRALVLLHEQEHLRGADPWLSALGRAVRILAPWNPVVWLVTSRLARAIELDCDRRVLARRPDVEAYGTTLLLVSEKGSRLLPAAAFAASEAPLRRRILAMTTPPRRLSRVGATVTLALGATLLGGAAAVPVPVVRAAQVAQVELPEPRVISDPRSQVVPIVDRTSGIVGNALRAPAGIWFPLGVGARTGVLTVPARSQSAWGWVSSAAAPGVSEAASRLLVETGGQVLSDEIRELTAAPRILNPDVVVSAIAAEYPLRLREQGLGGTVGVQFLVGSTGAVQRIRIGQISAYRDLDEAALRVAEVYQFSPGEADGEPVAIWVVHAIDFRVP